MSQLDIVLLLESAYAKYLDQQITKATVKTFAAEFADFGRAQQRSQILFGHQQSTFNATVDPEVVEEIATFEARLEVMDLKNHRAALQLMAEIVFKLTGYEPYTKVMPLSPVSYGAPTYSRDTGIWVYGATFRTMFYKPNDFVFLEVLPDIEVVSVGLYNSWLLNNQDATLIKEVEVT